MLCGGTSDVKPADAETQQIADAIRSAAEAACKKTFDRFELLGFKTQVVAGQNYFMKIKVTETECIHLRVFKSLQGETSLHSFEEGKAVEDDLAYF